MKIYVILDHDEGENTQIYGAYLSQEKAESDLVLLKQRLQDDPVLSRFEYFTLVSAEVE
jgi:hypothetical protein